MLRDDIDSANPVSNHPSNHGMVFWFQALPGWGQSPVLPNLLDVGKSSRVNFPRDGLTPTWTYNRINRFPQPYFNNVASEGYTLPGASIPSAWKLARHLTYSLVVRAEVTSKVAMGWNNGGIDSWQVFITSGGGVRLTMGGSTLSLSVPMTDGKDHLVTCSYDGETVRGYADGRLILSGAKSADVGYAVSNAIYLGRNGAVDATFDFQGSVSDFCLWKRALHPSEVMHRYVEWQLGYPTLLNRQTFKSFYGTAEVFDPAAFPRSIENLPVRLQERRVVAY